MGPFTTSITQILWHSLVAPELLIDFLKQSALHGFAGADWKEDAQKAELMGPELSAGVTDGTDATLSD